MDADRPSILSPRLVVGLTILAFGAILLLDNLGTIDGQPLLDWLLPVALLALAGACFLQGRRCFGWGLVWGAVGALLVANRLGAEFDLHSGKLIAPAVLILLGVVLVRRSLGGPAAPRGGLVDAGSTVDTFAALGGNEIKSASQEFRGGNAAAFMGGCKIDLRQARTVKPGAVLDVLAFWEESRSPCHPTGRSTAASCRCSVPMRTRPTRPRGRPQASSPSAVSR